MNDLQSQPHSLSVYSKAAVQLIKDTICKGATDQELELFVEVCKRTSLDPFTKQIYAVKRWDSGLQREVMSTQISIDGLRVIAERSGKYQGQQGPFWCGEDGVWVDCWLKDIPPVAAKVGVIRLDFKEPLWATARFNVYAQRKKDQSLTKFWLQMPDLMIAKVAEGLALRKAFPNDCSDFYFSEEGQQATLLAQDTAERIRRAFENPIASTKPALPEAILGDPLAICDPETGELREAVTAKSGLVPEEDQSYTPVVPKMNHFVDPQVVPKMNHQPLGETVHTLDQFDAYTVPFGKKHYGRTLKAIGLKEAKDYAKWLKETAKGKPLNTSTQKFLDMVKEYEAWLHLTRSPSLRS